MMKNTDEVCFNQSMEKIADMKPISALSKTCWLTARYNPCPQRLA